MKKVWNPPNGGNGRGPNGAIAPGQSYDEPDPPKKAKKKKATKRDSDQDKHIEND